MIHDKPNGVPAFSTAEAVIELLVGADVEGRGFFVMKRTVRLVAGARTFERNITTNEIYDIGGSQYLLNGFFRDEAHGSACFPGVFPTAQPLIELIPLLTADDVADAASAPAEAGMILVALDIKTIIKGKLLAGFDLA